MCDDIKYYIGIDPGIKGAISIIYKTHNVEEVIDNPLMPDNYICVKSLQDFILSNIPEYDLENTLCFVEEQFSRPIEGVKRARKSGHNEGRIQATLELLGVQYAIVRSQRWKKHFNLIKKTKKDSIKEAIKNFPCAEIGNKDGRAESLLIALYGKNTVEKREV